MSTPKPLPITFIGFCLIALLFLGIGTYLRNTGVTTVEIEPSEPWMFPYREEVNPSQIKLGYQMQIIGFCVLFSGVMFTLGVYSQRGGGDEKKRVKMKIKRKRLPSGHKFLEVPRSTVKKSKRRVV